MKKDHRAAPISQSMVLCMAMAFLVVLFYIAQEYAPGHSVEVSFTDASAGGLKIVPASCPSGAPGVSSDGRGYVVPNGTNGAYIGAQGSDFCLTNSGGPTYFIPFGTAPEIQQVYNVVSAGGVPGLSVRLPASYH